MTRSGSFPDRVRVADADDGYFRSCAGEQRQEDPHGAFLRSGCAAHVRGRRGCFVWCSARVSRVRAHGLLGCAPCRRRLSAPKTWLNRCLRVLFRSARGKASPRKSRAGHASGPRRGQVDSTTAMQEPCICEAGLLSHLVPSRGGPRGSRRARERPSLPPARRPRHRAQRRPLLESKAHSLLPLPELDAGAARLKAAPRPQWRSSTSGAGSRRTSTC